MGESGTERQKSLGRGEEKCGSKLKGKVGGDDGVGGWLGSYFLEGADRG